MKLLLATNNPGKVAEYRVLLEELPWELLTPSQVGIQGKPEETGATFEENALLKARYYATLSSLVTLADDSGLEVDALNGGPGIYSARYGGAEASDEARNRLLLKALQDVPWERRTARFRCVVALVWPDGREETFHGLRAGYVSLEPKGSLGFGYDPVFLLPELGLTFGEMPPQVKNRWSHRAEAADKAAATLRRGALLEVARAEDVGNVP